MTVTSSLTGQRFGRLTVLEQTEDGRLLCRCDCGNTVTLADTLLLTKFFTSCGCARGEGRKKDITGLRSGKVVALAPTEEKRRGVVLWKCRCDCGREFLTEGYKISNGVIESCGCLRSEHKIKDLTNQRFGRLTALRRLDKKLGSSYAWLCRCDCGQLTEVSANALLQGGTKSCGCIRSEMLKKRAGDIAGQRFGRLVALEPTEGRMGGSVVWKCRCDCGGETEVSYNSLVQGNTKSCGCLPKEHESPVSYMRYIDGTCVEMLERKGLRKDNTSGYTGVMAYRGKWKAQITFKGKLYNLGTYSKIEDAAKARKEAEERIFGEFLNWYYENHPKKTAQSKA
ncbi:MAG: transcriptional regulator [Eubacteriales bacterium]|nr:transcriptional regulator [Eubacteriales bacterium]